MTAVPGPMYFMGRFGYPYSTGPSDGECPEKWNGSSWVNLSVSPNNNGFGLASACYDAANGIVFQFSSIDSTSLAEFYDLATDSYTSITTPFPISVGGAVTFAAVGAGQCWLFGGQKNDFSASAAIQSYPASRSNGAFTTRGFSLAAAAGGLFGCVRKSTGKFYFGGGETNPALDPPSTIAALNTFYSFDPNAPAAPTALATMPVGLCKAACAIMPDDNMILCVGGAHNGGQAETGTASVYVYSIDGGTIGGHTLSANSWLQLNNFPVGIYAGAAVANNGLMYCGGGWNSTGFDINQPNGVTGIYVYNPSNDSWALQSNMNTPAPGSILISTSIPNTLFFGAGTTS